MALTRAQIRTLVLDATGRTDKTTLINTAIDLGVEEFSTQYRWSDLLIEADATLTADVQSVALASDVARIIEIRLIDGNNSRTLRIRSKDWIVKHFPNPSATNSAKATFGYLQGTTLFVVPIPDSAYTIRYSYYKLSAALTTDAQEVDVRHSGAAIAAYATYWVFQTVEKHEDAERWLATYLKLLDSAKRTDKENSVTTQVFDQRGEILVSQEFWLDPFVGGTPGISIGGYYGGY